MRRALIGTVAGWLAGAASVLAQSPLPASRGSDSAPPADRMPADRGPAVSPYAQYSRSTQGSATFDGPAYEEQRRQTMYRPTAGRTMNNVNAEGPEPMAPLMGGPNMAPLMGNMGNMGNGPQFLDCGGRCANNNCGDGCGNCRCPNGVCGPDGRFWFSSEYLLWWTTGQPLPPLLTAAPPGTDRALAGRLDQPATTILFGGNRVNTGVQSAYRARAGMWLDECQMLGVEGSFFFLSNDFHFDSGCCDANMITTRPFVDVNPAVGRQNTELVCFPGVLHGNVHIDGRTDLFGADANLRRNLVCTPGCRVDLIGGYRFMSLNDRLTIQECLVVLAPAAAVGQTIQVFDRFATDNRFHGGQIGISGEFRSGKLFVDWRGLVALGASIQSVTVSGDTTFTTPGGPSVNQQGGLLAQPTNIGTRSTTDFGVLPEVGINVGANVTDYLRVWVGYSYLYWNTVVRAGQQIDLTVNSSQLPFNGQPGVLVGPARPAPVINKSDFYMHGISFGAQLRF